MPVAPRPFIQVAGVKSLAEAKLLMNCGVGYLGFPLRLNVHAADTSEAEAAQIIRSISPPHTAVLITYLCRAQEIQDLLRTLGVRAVQLHGKIEVAEIEKLKRADPGLFIIKSLVITGANQAELGESIRQTAFLVDAFITDTFDPATGASGATGKTHDWALSSELVAASPKPVILAGGLNPQNVATAMKVVQPAGVDVHTGVEDSLGNKDPKLVKAFVVNALAAYRGTLE